MRIAILSIALISLLSFTMPTAYASAKGQSDGMKFLIRIASPEEIKRQKEIEQRKATQQEKAGEIKSTDSAASTEPSKTEEAFRKKKQEEKKAEPKPTKRWE